jgi:PAS domain S-box-containing protein
MRKKMDKNKTKNKFINDLVRLYYLIFMRIVMIRLIIAFLFILTVSGIIWAEGIQVKIGIGALANRGSEKCIEQWEPTAEYLNAEIPDYSFKIVPLPYEKVFPAVERGEVDFVLINPSLYVQLEARYGISRLLTLKNLWGKDEIKLYGGVILCRAERNDIRELNDIKGKSFMACDQLSLGGWHAAWRELKDQDIDPYRDFAELLFGSTHDTVVYAVRDGSVDAGSIRTGILENMAAEGKIDLATFRIVNQRKTEGFPFVHSTRLYPEWPFAKIKSTADELAQKVAIALLQMPEDCAAAKAARCAGWTIPLNYQPVLECLKELRIGPYKEFGKITLNDIIKQYWYWIVIVFALLILMVFSTLYVLRLNRRLDQSKSDLKKELYERKRVAGVLRESEEKYRNLFESSLDGIISTDMQGNILDINQAYLDMLGYAKEEIKKLTFQQLTPEKWLKKEEDIIKNQIIARGYSDEYEKENIKKDGLVFPISIRVWLIKDERGKPVGMWRFVRDITDLKQMQERLMRQEKLAILGQLAGGVAHELRNPLGAVKNAAYFLNMVLGKPEPEVKESLQILEREVGTSERIISSLLDFARPKSPTRRKVDINSVIQETLSRINLPQNINVVNQLQNAVPTILADPDQLKQVFTNIILNATQAMPEGGKLVVKSEVANPEWLTVSFTDTGVGMPKDSLPKIFEPLFTTKAKGIGLGLAVTKTLIEGQGGTIQVQSKVGKGSTFTVKLPISKKEEEQHG